MCVRYLLPLLLTACQTGSPTPPADYAIAAPAYLVLAQKALTYQTDFDLDAWSGLLSDSVAYRSANGASCRRSRAVFVADWQRWRQQSGVATLHVSGLSHLPVVTAQGLGPGNPPGVYVVSYCTARLRLQNGTYRERMLSVWYHFDAHRRIDHYALFWG